MSGAGWIAVDLDGTLARYDDWVGPEHVGEPIGPMVARVRAWLDAGRDVRIFTARVSHHATEHIARAAIYAWCELHLGRVIPVTNVKDYEMAELWDDRAVQVVPNEGHPVGQSTRGLV